MSDKWELFCLNCASHNSTTCSTCDNLTTNTISAADGRSICRRCEDYYSTCDRCGALTDDLHTTADSGLICENCADVFWSCDGCNALIDSGSYCNRCDQPDSIHSYSFKPEPQFHGEGKLFLGLELEVNCPGHRTTECANLAVDALGSLGYLKEDDSIDQGFELVTHPMSYEWAIQNFPWQTLKALGDIGCDAEGIGLHVHVSRAGFDSTVHQYRWLKFIYRNEDAVCRIARRRNDRWASFVPSDRANAKSYAKGSKGFARYRAINTLPDTTYEMRMFASSLDPREVQAALALAAASVEYTRRLTVSDIHHHSGWSWAAFLAWTSTRPEYQPLNQEWTDLACAC